MISDYDLRKEIVFIFRHNIQNDAASAYISHVFVQINVFKKV